MEYISIDELQKLRKADSCTIDSIDSKKKRKRAVDDAAEGQIEVNYTGKWFLRSENEIRDEVISHLTEHKTTDDFSDGDSNGESGMRVTSRGAVSFISAADLKKLRC